MDIKKVIKKGTLEFNMIVDFIKLYQEYNIPTNDDNFWESVISDANTFINKYKSINISRKLANVLLNDLEERLKDARQ